VKAVGSQYSLPSVEDHNRREGRIVMNRFRVLCYEVKIDVRHPCLYVRDRR